MKALTNCFFCSAVFLSNIVKTFLLTKCYVCSVIALAKLPHLNIRKVSWNPTFTASTCTSKRPPELYGPKRSVSIWYSLEMYWWYLNFNPGAANTMIVWRSQMMERWDGWSGGSSRESHWEKTPATREGRHSFLVVYDYKSCSIYSINFIKITCTPRTLDVGKLRRSALVWVTRGFITSHGAQ